MADHEPLEISGRRHWFMLIILLLFLFSFIVKIVLRVKARTNSLPWVKSVGSFWFLTYYLWAMCLRCRCWGRIWQLCLRSCFKPRNSAISPSLTLLGGGCLLCPLTSLPHGDGYWIDSGLLLPVWKLSYVLYAQFLHQLSGDKSYLLFRICISFLAFAITNVHKLVS